MAEPLRLKLDYTFRQPELLRQALTHRSFGTPHNERMEFVGDAVLNCVVGATLYERFPTLPEGDLSRVRAGLVNGDTLARVARQLGIGHEVLLGEGEMKSGGAPKALETIATFIVSRMNNSSPWYIDRLQVVAKPK